VPYSLVLTAWPYTGFGAVQSGTESVAIYISLLQGVVPYSLVLTAWPYT